MTEEKCLRCNSSLVRKTGKHGPFRACSKYPLCSYTASVPWEEGAVGALHRIGAALEMLALVLQAHLPTEETAD